MWSPDIPQHCDRSLSSFTSCHSFKSRTASVTGRKWDAHREPTCPSLCETPVRPR